MAYIITFETEDPTVATSLREAVEALGEWIVLTSQSYLLDTSSGIRSMMETLQPILGPADGLWVFTAAGPWSGYGDPITDDYLHGQLGPSEDYIPKDWDAASRRRI